MCTSRPVKYTNTWTPGLVVYLLENASCRTWLGPCCLALCEIATALYHLQNALHASVADFGHYSMQVSRKKAACNTLTSDVDILQPQLCIVSISIWQGFRPTRTVSCVCCQNRSLGDCRPKLCGLEAVLC